MSLGYRHPSDNICPWLVLIEKGLVLNGTLTQCHISAYHSQNSTGKEVDI